MPSKRPQQNRPQKVAKKGVSVAGPPKQERPLHIAFVVPECSPFAKTGGLADVAAALPRALAELGCRVSVVMPRYGSMQRGKTLVSSLTVPLGPKLHFPAVQAGPAEGGVEFFFVDYPAFYDRDGLYQTGGSDYADNAERFALLCRAALEFLKRAEPRPPDILHCHDWQAALAPVLLKSLYASDPVLGRVPCVLTVHNLGYQGVFPRETMERLGLPGELFRMEGLEYWGKVNFLKGGLAAADRITTVSRKYAQEIQTPEYGCGLEGLIRSRAGVVRGILNGVDYGEWNPSTDRRLAANFTSDNLAGKRLCKKDLLDRFNLPVDDLDRPLVGIVSRFAAQKGFDLISDAAEEMMKLNIQVVALGVGEPFYEKLFRDLGGRFPGRFGVRIAYDDRLAHKIEAGSDLFLMPSRYEPCGLNQIYSLRYGTAPVVRGTGGLDDTIVPFDARTGKGTGFKFEPYTGVALLRCLRGALEVYEKKPAAWRKLMQNAMAADFSWGESAGEYISLYEELAKSAATR